MAEYKPYFEKLKDPRWQKKRLEIMERAEFKCEWCGDEEKTLNVHHKFYRKGADPWDYPDHALTTLCEECHEEIGAGVERLLAIVGDGFFLDQTIGFALGYGKVVTGLKNNLSVSNIGELEGFLVSLSVPLWARREREAAEAEWRATGVVTVKTMKILEEVSLCHTPPSPKKPKDTGHSYAGWWLTNG